MSGGRLTDQGASAVHAAAADLAFLEEARITGRDLLFAEDATRQRPHLEYPEGSCVGSHRI